MTKTVLDSFKEVNKASLDSQQEKTKLIVDTFNALITSLDSMAEEFEQVSAKHKTSLDIQ